MVNKSYIRTFVSSRKKTAYNFIASLSLLVLFLSGSFNTVSATTQKTWDFTSSSGYSYNSSNIEISGGKAQLKALTGWYDTSWNYRKKITIDHTKVDATQSNFPVLVNLSSDSDLSAGARSDGHDILFTASDGTTKLDYERELYTPATGELVSWVKVPSLSGSADTEIYMYYGNPPVSSDQANTTGTWDSNFKGVWHMQTGSTMADATGVNNGTVSGGVVTSGNYFFDQTNVGTILGPTDHTAITSPHTLSVVRPNPTGQYNGHTYWGYIGPQDQGSIDLRWSEDLETWTAYGSNPIVSGSEDRWASVLYEGNTFYMVHTVDYLTDSYITLMTSADGISFSYVSDLVPATVGEDMRNPYLFKDPVGGDFYLFYKRSYGTTSEIRMKTASTITGLAAASSTLIMTRDASVGTLAAPSMFYYDGVYWLMTEGGGSPWVTEAYYGTSPSGSFTETGSNWVLGNGSACPFPYIENDTLYDYICYQVDGVGAWELDLQTSDLTASLPKPIYRAASFKGTDGVVTVADNASLDFSTAFTLEAWVNTKYWTSPNNAPIIDKFYDGSTRAYYMQAVTGGEIKVGIANADGTAAQYEGSTTGMNMDENTWYHIAVKWNTTTGTIDVYKNGQFVESLGSGLTASIHNNTAEFRIGEDYSVDDNYSGMLDEVRASNVARSAEWISTEYNNQFSPSTFYTLATEGTQYSTSDPTIQPTSANAQTFTSLSSFTESATKNSGEIKYQLSNDGGTTWYYYNSGWQQTSSGYSSANTASQINSYISSFPTGGGSFLFRAYLHSDGSQLVQLSSVVVGYENNPSSSLNIYGPSVTYDDTTATVTWTTDRSSTSRVDYGFTENYVSREENTDLTTNHSMNLSDLLACHEYHYRVYSKDADNNDRFSGDNTFTTTGCASSSSSSTGTTRYAAGSSAFDDSSTGFPTTGTAEGGLRFNASDLFPGIDIVSYSWDFGDGSTDEGRIVNHSYSAPGRYKVVVIGIDAKGIEHGYTTNVDIVPKTPDVSNVTASDMDIVITGSGYKGDTIYLTIHSNPHEAQTQVDSSGNWTYTLAQASEVIGEGSHSVTAVDSYKLEDGTQLKSDTTDDIKFKVTVDNGKLKVEMERTSAWRIAAYILGGIIILGAILFLYGKRQVKS